MRGRLLFLRAISLIIFVALLVRLQQLHFGAVAQDSRSRIDATVQRQEFVLPQRGEIFASDGTLLAAAVPTSVVAVRADGLPGYSQWFERTTVMARISSVLPITDTFTISPTTALHTNQPLAQDVFKLVPMLPASISFAPGVSVTLDVPLYRSMEALQISKTFSDVVILNPGVERLLRQADLPPYMTVPIASDVPREIVLALRENQAVLPGIKVVEQFRRAYPLSAQIPTISHVLGYTGAIQKEELDQQNSANGIDGPLYLFNDVIGKEGLEFSYESTLRGRMGVNQIEVDVAQRTVGEPRVLRPLVDGQNLILHLDLRLQKASEDVLHKWLRIADERRVKLKPEFAPIKEGVIIVMEVNTGAILASVSLPAYDNNVFTRPLTQRDVETIYNDLSRPLFNRAIAERYPPGSTFKQFTAAAGLRYGAITPQTKIFDPGLLVVKNEYFEEITDKYPNSGQRVNGLISVSDALKVSSNVFFHTVAGGTEYVTNITENDPRILKGIGIDNFSTMLGQEYGFGARTGIDLPYEARGVLPSRQWKQDTLQEVWSIGDTYLTAIGQGNVAVTPMQLLRATAATANGGKLYQPRLVKAITSLDHTQTITVAPTLEHEIILDPAYWDVIREGMRRSVQEPDSSNQLANYGNLPAGDLVGDMARFKLAGKTGTAEYQTPTGTYRSHSWFVGFAPYDQPQIAVLALLEGTGDLGDGSATLTLPAVVDVLRAYYGQPIPDANGNLGALPQQ